MRKFAQLYRALDLTVKANIKINALVDYFNFADDADKVWVIALFSKRRPQRIIAAAYLRKWSEESTGLPYWLFEGCYNIVGDLTETIALIAPNPIIDSNRSLSDWIKVIIDLKDKEERVKKETILNAWNSLGQDERFLFNKLVTGGFRISVPQKILISALSKYSGIDHNKITHRLMSKWDPLLIHFDELVLNTNPTEDLSIPYPLCTAQPLDSNIEQLGDPTDWIAERKWEGIRGQLILRQNEYYLWTNEEELVSEKFPELEILKNKINIDVVIDGEILPFKEGKILNYITLQSRIGRKNITKKHLADTPIIILASDLLEYNGKDIREEPLTKRRELLETVIDEISSDRLLYSDEVKFKSWDELAVERENSRAYLSEGILLKHKDSQYESNGEKGEWRIWKIDPFTINAVLIYVQRGIGKKATTYTDFTFAVKQGESLVPFAKASSGLSEEEIEEIALFVKKNTKEKFGPVRSIEPELVFEIEFDSIAKSSRHKSGVKLRLPKIKKWWREKPKEEINTLQDLNKILAVCEGNQE